MEDTTTNVEQQQNLLSSAVQTERSKSKTRWSQTVYRTITEHYWPILLLLIVIMISIGVVAYFPRLESNETEDGIVLKQGTSFNRNQQSAHGQNPMQQMSFGRPKPPEALGRITIYIRKPSPDDDDDRKPPLRVYIPAARYYARRFPLKGPFLNFMLSTPIFANRATQETIIYSPSRVYILPALTDGRGKLYSIARLIATGYASFTAEEMHSSKSIDVNTYFQSSAVTGARVPKIDTQRGGFSSGLRVNVDSFGIYGDEDMNDDSDEYYEEDNDKNNKHHHTYDKPRHRNSKDDSSETTITSTKKTTSVSTATKKSVPHYDHAGVNFTLILEYIFPYPQSKKPVIGINGTSPGPLIDVFENDTVIIRVINRLDVPTAIHWHGVRQIGTPDMDGAVGLSQCAIPPGHEMIYKFQATPAGSTWYHGHLLEQLTDGLFGPLIIRRRPESYSDLYQSEQILTIADWYNIPAHTGLVPYHYSPTNPFGLPPPPDAIVVNGSFTQSLVIPANGSEVIRFRVICATAFSMFTISIDGLRLYIIEVDTTTTIPYAVDSFTVNVAQRVSFYVNLTELDPTYNSSGTPSVYIRIQANEAVYAQDVPHFIPPYENRCYPYPTFFTSLYLAVLSLDSTNSAPTYAASSATPILSNVSPPLDTNILDARPLIRNADGIPDSTHYCYIEVTFGADSDGYGVAFVNNVTYSSDANYMHMRDDPPAGFTSDLYEPLVFQMVRKAGQLAIPSPLLQAGNDLPVIQSDQNGHYLIPYQAVVDILINNTAGGEHPFHLHGHNFWIVSSSDYPEAEKLYAGDYIQRDTVSVPAGGWAKIRFVADNPGAWFFHCHIEWHMADGLAVAIIVAPEQLLTNGYNIPQSGQKQCEALQRFNTTYDPVLPSN
ncbi:unnamed protein product [Adineta steineri]|uniref:Multicopper oxidase n=1 Tax=Adineta steineri TaxID=433720 RepID=A0A813TUD0_9BILA|nr:unnamed protein product [Adineta steineri]